MTRHTSSPPPVHLPQAVAAQIIAHAREGKPEEICGIVRGRGLHALEAVRGRNIAGDRIENYEVDPETLLRQFEFEDEGDEMMGIYHSHPVSEAYPSATDAWNAHYPDAVYFICSLEDDAAPVIRAFRMTTSFLAADALRLIQDVPFHETRPGLFAYYQSATGSPSPALAPVVNGVSAPYYVVYYAPPEPDREPEVRAVSIIEHPVSEKSTGNLAPM
jgi:[CysO sulfur-carrier protein]-S-L-cysteine hydrolase